MKIELAKTAGFCFGVRRAVDTVYQQVEQAAGKPIYTYGPIIHNDEVVRDLEKKGVQVLNSREELAALEEGTVIIRSHGVSREICDLLKGKDVRCVDATCPFVKKIHRIVSEESEKGAHIVIIGNPEHPEVKGISGWAKGPVTILQTKEEAEGFAIKDPLQKVCIVSQTTFNYNKFKELVEIMDKKGYDIIVLNTICNATQERQVEAKEIASKVDAMIVIGGKNSSNTQKLYEICLNECKNTYYIQTLGDFDPESVNSVRSVGITAGASTPKKIIEEVHTNVRVKF